MCHNDIGSQNLGIDSIRTKVVVATVPSEHTASFEHHNTTSKIAVMRDEFYRPKRFDHQVLLWLFNRVTGKTQAERQMVVGWYYFLTRSRWRAYWWTLVAKA
jgi:hypothetical protein